MTEQAVVPTVHNVADRHRYEIRVDDAFAGLTAYHDRGEQRVFYHTEIDDAFAGRGLASVLVREALNDVRAAGMRVVPVCPYVKQFLGRYEEFADLVDPVTPEILRWLQETRG
ncbi:GNAT family N-acetyltransferase [Embleya scabrispora]|uniref:GNAT family N-acetyltransferase n=1 Tax=Embleya scabrispora TaxID=159449 RepID=A0A1T3NN08_9ACTN|nr:GNAT family N-acetyltransferase [Embleya scabrispora]OPC78112.1 GNAT family N-acetyltransferase [Embleya scabrispora]